MTTQPPNPLLLAIRRDPILLVVLWMVVLSLLIWALVLTLGLHLRPAKLHESVDYTTYFEAINWWPFPLFFLAVAPVLYLSWGSFLKAWRDLARTHVLQHKDGSEPSESVVEEVLAAITRHRRWACLAAGLAALIINGLDLQDKGSALLGSADLKTQTQYFCADFNAWNKWFIEARSLYASDACVTSSVEEGTPRIEPPFGVLVFIVLTWFQQTAIVFFAALAIGQLLFHGILFWGFERLVPAARQHDLLLRLNAGSEVGEFGLERWNYALNNLYWAASPALLGVFLSRASTSAEFHDPGQQLMGILVPACLLAPMIVSILSRQSRLPFVWPEVGREDGFPRDLYARQLLWPLDRNWSSKLGIILAFVLAALSLGYEMRALLPLT